MHAFIKALVPVYVAVGLVAAIHFLGGCSNPQDLAITADPQTKPIVQVTPQEPTQQQVAPDVTIINDTNMPIQILSEDLISVESTTMNGTPRVVAPYSNSGWRVVYPLPVTATVHARQLNGSSTKTLNRSWDPAIFNHGVTVFFQKNDFDAR